MFYLEFLRRLHERLEPATYFEIGVRRGDSLALARRAAAGVDPAHNLRVVPPADTKLFRETSDAYFARPKPLAPFGGRPIDLAFIDGMHLAEFAMRDFAGVERLARWTSVVVFDDIFPRDPVMAARDRRTRAWTGDVYKILEILARYRPDLVCLRVDTEPTGLGLVLGLDPLSDVLITRYHEILEDVVVEDPQHVPAAVLERRGAVAPDRVLRSELWTQLTAARATQTGRRSGLRRLHRAVRHEFGRITDDR
jgi:hypothetical protein